MKVIVVNHTAVLPARTGGQQAVLGLSAELAVAWPTELVWTERKTAATGRVEAGTGTLTTTVIPNLWRQRRVAKWLRRWLGSVDNDIGSMLCSGANRRLVEHLLAASSDGDVFVLAHPWLWPALQRVLARRRALLVYDAHNIEHRLKAQSLRPSAITDHVVARIRRLETRLVQRADLTLACTQRDADVLRELAGVPAARLLVGSKGVAGSARAEAIAVARAGRAAGRTALFVGSKHPPNNAAARWIIETLAPACPDWRFDIAGACGPAAGVLPRSANVRVLGPVDDLLPLLATADVGLNPVNEGSGINMKLFDFMQCGLPVLSTPFGARGLEGLNATGMLLRERDGFAAALAAWAADPEAARRLGAEGVLCVRRHFVWPVVGARVRAGIEALL